MNQRIIIALCLVLFLAAAFISTPGEPQPELPEEGDGPPVALVAQRGWGYGVR